MRSKRPGRRSARRRAEGSIALLFVTLLALSAPGCFKAVNVPLDRFDPEYGYRPSRRDARRDRGDVIVYLAFSGGGTRAAALAYGVLQAMRDTRIGTGDDGRTLLDEVDTVSGVSGGSFPAAYYGLFGDRIFEDFEERFLRRNIQGAIVLHTLIPWNLVALPTPWLSRSDIAKGIYDESIFESATFDDLTDAHGPTVYINATDLSSGERFTFVQGQFDMICSDLQALPIAYAVAASSAVPVLLSPVSMRNHAGTCGYEPHPALFEALRNPRGNPRQYRVARHLVRFHDPAKEFLHLVDGGISDNLGLRAGIDLVEVAGGWERAAELMQVERHYDKYVVIVVNAETDPDPSIDLSSAAPGFASMMNAVSGAQIRRYNFETLLLTQKLLQRLRIESRSKGVEVETFLIDVSFENLPDERDRRYFKRIPTSFRLSDHQVDQLMWAGRKLLLDSPDFQNLVERLEASPPESGERP